MTPEDKSPEDVNSGLQIDKEEKAFLAELKAERLAKEEAAAKAKKRTDFLAKLKETAGKESWDKLSGVKIKDKTIEDIFNENPEILDSSALVSLTMENYKNAGLNPASVTEGETGTDGGADPNNAGGGGTGGGADGYVMPKVYSAEFFSDIKEGKLTRELIANNEGLDPDVRFGLLMSLPKTAVKVDNNAIRNEFGLE